MQRPISAKAETAAIKPMFCDAFRRSRVLVPAEVVYEWKLAAGGKKPFAIGMRDGSPFAMAGLLERWRAPGAEVLTYAILTTEANALVAEIHSRMPAIIAPEDYGRWLNPELSDVVELQKMLEPYRPIYYGLANDRTTNYDELRVLAIANSPKLIIVGGSAFP